MGGSGKRSDVSELMSKLVPVRNRIAHHETVVRTPLVGHHDDMLRLSALIDPEAALWIQSISQVPAVLLDRP